MAYRYVFKFSKTGDLIYISHLDVMRLLNRAARRAELPVSLTQGFHPHLKIKLKQALKLGVSADCEEGEFSLEKNMSEGALLERWNGVLPQGIEIKEIKTIDGD